MKRTNVENKRGEQMRRTNEENKRGEQMRTVKNLRGEQMITNKENSRAKLARIRFFHYHHKMKQN